MQNQESESKNTEAPRTDEAGHGEVVQAAGSPMTRLIWLKRSIALLGISGAIWLAVFIATPYRPAPIDPVQNDKVKTEAAIPESIESRLLGTWEDDYHGKRTLTLRPDGTGTMICELAGWEASVFAKKLTFEEAWYVADGSLTMRVTGGEPQAKIDFVLKIEGDRTTQKILELTDDRLLLLDSKGDKQFDWRRVAKPAVATPDANSASPIDSAKPENSN